MRAQISSGPFRRRAVLTAATMAACASIGGTASAVTLTFDSDSTTTADIVDGSGNWNTTAGNTVWRNGASNVIWTTGSDAVFGGTLGTPGTVTINTAAITPNSMTFNVDGYTIADTSTTIRLILASPGGITANGNATVKTFRAATSQTESQTWTVAPGKSFTMDATPGAATSQFFVGGNTDAGKTLTLGGGGTVNFIASSSTFGLNVPQNSNLVVNNALVTATGRSASDDVAVVFRGRTGAGLASKATINTGGVLDVSTNTVTVQMNTDGVTFQPLGVPAELHLDGGTIALGGFGNATSTPTLSSTGALYFNGGEVKANKSNATFMVAPFVAGVGGAGLSAVYVGANGANMNTNGFDITVATPLIPDPASPGGGFTKKGAGTLTLTAASTYTGATAVNAGTLTVLDPSGLGGAAGALAVNNPNTGAGTDVVLNLSTTAATTKGSLSGAIAAPSGGTNTAAINNGGQLFTVNQTTPGTYQGTITGAGGFALGNLSTAALTLSGANSYTGGTSVNAGTLVLGNADATAGGAINVADGAVAQAQAGLPKAITLTTLSTNTSGKFDLTNNSMVVKGMTDTDVRSLLQAGYNAGHWDGATGITSSTAAASTETSVGYASNASLNLTTFKGVDGLTASDVLVKYTYAGDANLDGKVDIGDLGLLAGAWQQSGKVWFDGDFTYNGTVDIGDLGLLAGNWQKGVGSGQLLVSFDQAMAQFAAFDGVVVPEPASLSLLALGGLALLGRRRRILQS